MDNTILKTIDNTWISGEKSNTLAIKIFALELYKNRTVN